MGQLQLVLGVTALLSILAFLLWFWTKAIKIGEERGAAKERKRYQKEKQNELDKNVEAVTNPNAGMSISKLRPTVSDDPS